jgi:type I restriction enzyme S subunit
MTHIETRPIREYALGIYDGPHATPKESSDGAVFLGIKNITADGQLDLSDIRFVSEEEFSRWTRRVTPQCGDVVLTYEATLHRYAIIPEGFRGCLGRRVALVRPNPEKADSRYLLYYFLSYQWRKTVESYVITGATVDRIPIEKFPEFPVSLPEVKEQSRIASILSAYDDLIENNRRRMGLLEQAARQLYREWFVRLRFPGHEHVKNTNGVPEGWRDVPFSDLAAFVNGYPFKPDELGDEGLPIVKIPELRDGVTSKTPRNTGEKIPEKYLLKDGDLLFSWSGTLLAEFWYDGPAILNQHLFRVEPNDLYSPPFVLFALREALPKFTNQTVGATMKHIRKGALTTVTTKLPPHTLLVQFAEIATTIYRKVLNPRRQNQKLRAARDLLLPKLMSGEVEV